MKTLDQDIRILGREHPYNDTKVGTIEEAFIILSKEEIL